MARHKVHDHWNRFHAHGHQQYEPPQYRGGFLLWISSVQFSLNRRLTAVEQDFAVHEFLCDHSPTECAYHLRLREARHQ
jgi:hypothetical protein